VLTWAEGDRIDGDLARRPDVRRGERRQKDDDPGECRREEHESRTHVMLLDVFAREK
jgi:hypothetical protein